MAHLKVLRPLNLFIVAFTQAILFYLIYTPSVKQAVLSFNEFWLLVLCTVIIAAAGYLINDIYDHTADIVNKPDKTWVGVKISYSNAWTYYFTLLITGFIIAIYLGWQTDNLPLISLYPLACTALWLYANTLKRSGLAGNMIVAMMTSFVCVILIIAERKVLFQPENFKVLSLFLGFSWFSFLVNIIREWVKDMEDMEGDRLLHSASMPIRKGIPFVKICCFIAVAVCILSVVFFVYTIPHTFHQKIFALVFVVAPLVKVATQIQKSRDAVDFHKGASGLKLIMMLGLIYLMLFSPIITLYGNIK